MTSQRRTPAHRLARHITPGMTVVLSEPNGPPVEATVLAVVQDFELVRRPVTRLQVRTVDGRELWRKFKANSTVRMPV